MRAVVQRVTSAQVTDKHTGQLFGAIGPGFCVLLGIGHGDDRPDADWLADKIVGLRVFPDPPISAAGAATEPKDMNRALSDFGGQILIISQFTLFGDASKGRRPSFIQALPPDLARPLYDYFVERVTASGLTVATGQFGAMMSVQIVNDGPVTLCLDSRDAPLRARRPEAP